MKNNGIYIVTDYCVPKMDEIVKDYPVVRGVLDRPIHKEPLLNMLSKGTGGTHSVRV